MDQIYLQDSLCRLATLPHYALVYYNGWGSVGRPGTDSRILKRIYVFAPQPYAKDYGELLPSTGFYFFSANVTMILNQVTTIVSESKIGEMGDYLAVKFYLMPRPDIESEFRAERSKLMNYFEQNPMIDTKQRATLAKNLLLNYTAIYVQYEFEMRNLIPISSRILRRKGFMQDSVIIVSNLHYLEMYANMISPTPPFEGFPVWRIFATVYQTLQEDFSGELLPYLNPQGKPQLRAKMIGGIGSDNQAAPSFYHAPTLGELEVQMKRMNVRSCMKCEKTISDVPYLFKS